MKINQGIVTLALLSFFLSFHHGLLAQPRMQFIHNSPDDSLETIIVNITAANGQILNDPIEYLWGTSFLSLAPGIVTISVSSYPGGDSLYTQTFTLAGSDTMITILNGIYDTATYPNIGTLHIDLVDGRKISSNSNKNDILVQNGSPDAPALTFKTTLGTQDTLGVNLPFRDFGPSYMLLDTNDSLIKVYDPTLIGLNRTYIFPSQYWGVVGQAGIIFASGFVDPIFTDSDPDFHLYYASNMNGFAQPLIELRNDAPIWRQDRYSTKMWFGEVDTFDCATYPHYWEFYDTNGTGPLNSTNQCNPVYRFPYIGRFPFSVTVNGQTYSDTTEVQCPVDRPDFVLEQDTQGYVTIEIHSTWDSLLNASYGPVLYTVKIGIDSVGPYPIDSFPRRMGPFPISCDPWEVAIESESTCGGTFFDRFQAMFGYVKDKPLRGQNCICSPGHTPIEWSRPNYQFLGDANQVNHVEDVLDNLPLNEDRDVLVYYFVPRNLSHSQVKDVIMAIYPRNGNGNVFDGWDRFSMYLTVASFRNANSSHITDFANCPYVVFVASDEPVLANDNFASNEYLKSKQILELLGLAGGNNSISDDVGYGNGVGLGIIGAGRANHFAFTNLPDKDCPQPVSGECRQYKNYATFVNSTFREDCKWDCNYDDVMGGGTAKASLLTTQLTGICPSAEYFFMDVVDDANSFKIRLSDVLEAFDWAIASKASCNPMSIVVCDFSMPTEANDVEAIAAMANIASSYGLAVFSGTGNIPEKLPAPGAAQQPITVASIVYENGKPLKMAGGQGEGDGFKTNDPLDLKPDLAGPCNAKGAHQPVDCNDHSINFNGSIVSPETPAFILAGMAALILQVNPFLNLEKLKWLFKTSAVSTGFDMIQDKQEGYGIIDPLEVINKLKRTPKCDLGFTYHYGKDTCVSHDSEDIFTELSNKYPGAPSIIQPQDLVHIRVAIRNFGANLYDPVDNPGTVSLRLHGFSNQTLHPYDIAYIEKPILYPIGPHVQNGYTDTIVMNFYYTALEAMDVFCAEASINAICDCEIENDIAKRNDYRICIDSTDFHNVWPLFGPNDSAEIISVVTETPANSGWRYESSFIRRIYAGSEYPIALFDTISIDSIIRVLGAKFCVTFFAVIDSDTVYNGGITYTICDTTAPVSTPALLPTDNIKIFPVPATQAVTIQVLPATSGPGTIEMFTLLGQMIERREVSWQNGITKDELFLLDDLPAGVYLFKIALNDRSTFKKFVKI